MPRYFFHIRHNGMCRSRDALGLSFPSVETAATEALAERKDLSAFSKTGASIRRTMPSKSRMKAAKSLFS